MTRVLVVDDHTVFRRGLARVLEDEGLEVVGEAADGREALTLCAELRPDVVLMDLHMPELDGVAATQELAATHAVLVLTVSDQDDDLRAAITAGARGYLLKNATPNDIVKAIAQVADGRSVLAPEMTALALDALRRQPAQTLPGLSQREREVLELLVRGHSNRAMAEVLAISPHTVKTYVERLYKKLGVGTRAEAAARARNFEPR